MEPDTPGLGGQQAHAELLLAHLQAEDGHNHPGVQGRVGGYVQGEGGLAHGGAARDDDEVAGLQAGGELVQYLETGGHSRNLALVLKALFDDFKGAGDHVAYRAYLLAKALLGGREDGPLRPFQGNVWLGLMGVGLVNGLVGRVDETPEQGFVLDQGGVVVHMGGAEQYIGQLGQIGRAAHGVQAALIVEPRGDGDLVHRLVLVVKSQHGIVDLAVAAVVEVRGFKVRGDTGQHLAAVDQHPAQHPALGGEVLGGGVAAGGAV